MGRENVPSGTISKALEDLRVEIFARLDKKGYGGFASTHEIFGHVQQELHEYEAEVHSRDILKMEKELFDTAVACIFGVASIRARTIDR